MTRPTSVLSILLAASAVASLAAQGAQTAPTRPQQRDAIATPTVVGTATIAGTVVTDDAEHRPVYRALVTATTSLLGVPHSVVTNEAGQYLITGLPPGNYTVGATKAAYVDAFYGTKRAGAVGGRGVPVSVLDGQHLTGFDLRLPHGAVITGLLRQPDGRPASGISVEISSIQTVGGQRQLSPDTQQITTDDRGIYRVFGLAPGDYLVVARPTLTGIPGGADPRPMTADEVQWALQATTPSGPTNALPALSAPPLPAQPVAFAPVYFPGTSEAAAATVLTLAVGEERGGVDFTISPVPTATLSGQVFGPDGAPAPGAFVQVISPDGDINDIVSSLIARFSAQPSGDGTFSMKGVKPGKYRLVARATPPSADAKGGPPNQAEMMRAAMAGFMGGGGGTAPTLWAQQDLTVDGHDMSGLTLRLQTGLTLGGKVVFETKTAPDTTQMRITLGPPVNGSGPANMLASLLNTPSASIDADGTFKISGLIPDRYRLGFTAGGMRTFIAAIQPDAVPDAPPDTIFLKSAMWKGRDLADVALDLQAGDDLSTPVVVTVTDVPAVLRGTVRDGAGRPTPNYPILVFSTDRALWFAGSRRIQQARVATDGTFKVVGLPAGEYFVAALTDLTAAELGDPAFLEAAVPASVKITLRDGEQKVQDLKLAGGGGVR
jgi:hypothetical protein